MRTAKCRRGGTTLQAQRAVVSLKVVPCLSRNVRAAFEQRSFACVGLRVFTYLESLRTCLVGTCSQLLAGQAVIDAATGHQVLVYDQGGANETCFQNRYGIMKLFDHGGSYPTASKNDIGNTFPDDLCLAVGVQPAGSFNGFTQNQNGYDAPTSDTDWPNDALQGAPMLSVWLK